MPARQQGGEQVTLIALQIGQEASRVDRTASAAREDEGQVGPAVPVAVLQARAPHHDAVVEQRAVAFPQAGHLVDHVGKLVDVEFRDRGHLRDLLRVVVVVGLGVVLVVETEFRIGDAVRR